MLDANSVAFKDIRHVQTALEASNHIIIIKVIPMFGDIKDSLRLVLSVVRNSATKIVPSLTERGLATVTRRSIDSIVYHDFGSVSSHTSRIA